eukprot:3687271-Amphidinium_carterae.1
MFKRTKYGRKHTALQEEASWRAKLKTSSSLHSNASLGKALCAELWSYVHGSERYIQWRADCEIVAEDVQYQHGEAISTPFHGTSLANKRSSKNACRDGRTRTNRHGPRQPGRLQHLGHPTSAGAAAQRASAHAAALETEAPPAVQVQQQWQSDAYE